MSLDNFKYNLRNLKKCDMYWDDMDVVPGGRMCSGCNKIIIDFSSMSYSEIALKVSESKNPICGYYLPEQLKQSKPNVLKYTARLGLSYILTLSLSNSAFSHDPINSTISELKVIDNDTQQIISTDLDTRNKVDTFIIKGKVQTIDSLSQFEDVSYCSAVIKGTEIGVASNEFGEFTLKFANSDNKSEIDIVISAIGIVPKEIKIKFDSEILETNLGVITVDKHDVEYTAFFVTKRKPNIFKRFWRKLGL